ncbi:hypothetical protein NC652_037920 [Populus alba x Populus x berolinensis]|nr:hypothetical protein NC652_037920 [Populus alba x Populus x berolinensis]
MEVNVIKTLTTQPRWGIMRRSLQLISNLLMVFLQIIKYYVTFFNHAKPQWSWMLLLINNDSKCSKIQTTKEIFDSVQRSNVCIWNWMINGLAVHELARDTIKVFTKMAVENVLPDSITFLGVLTACSHCGAVTEGHKCFDLMRNRSSIMESLWIHGRSSGSSWACRR